MTPDQLTPGWLSSVLDIDVSSVASERIGDGLVGLNLRLALDHDAGDSFPDSVVVKLPSLDAKSRSTSMVLRTYEREVKFYDVIADTVDIRTPRCHHGSWDETTGDFVLVLEDMAPAEQGDQIAGCSIEHALAAVRELADLHGPRWDDPTLDEHEFLTRRNGDGAGAELAGLWDMMLPGFLATYESMLGEQAVALTTAFGSRLAAWVDGRSGPSAVTHGDYRLDNLMFATQAGGPAVTAVDWQTPGHGVPISDLAYFCGAGLLPEVRRAHEFELVEAYTQRLAVHDVAVDSDWVDEQYRRDAFSGVIMAVIASQVVGGTDRSEAMFGAMATRHLQHALDLESIDLVD
jgi:hypothetical protein